MKNTELYEQDFFAWSEATAHAIRRREFSEIDLAVLAEEIQDMGRNDHRELKSRLLILVAHLLKYQFQPEKRSPSWRATIIVQRNDIQTLLEQSPSLRRLIHQSLAQVYQNAKELAAAEMGLSGESVFPRSCPYAEPEILDSKFWPD